VHKEENMNFLRAVSILSLSFLLVCSAEAQEKEKKIKRADLPAAVEKTVSSQSVGATIKGFSQEEEGGKVYYEAEMTVNGHSKDVLIAADGSIAEVEEEVALDSLPAPVKAGLHARSGSGKILKVESITKHDKIVAFEAKVEHNGKKSEIQVGPDGKPLDHEE
jgi:hypothetical protein